MKRKAIIIIIFIIINICAFAFTDELRENGYKLNEVFMHKYFRLIEKYPNIRNFMFRPSDRQLISFDSKAPSDTVTVLVLKIEFVEDTTSLTTGNGKMDIRVSMDGAFILDSMGDSTRNIYYDPPHDSLYFYRQMEAMQNYYLDDSHNKLFVDYDIYPKGLYSTYTVPHKMMFYGDTINIVMGMFSLLRDAIKEADIAGGVDFDRFDAVIVFHAGSMWQSDILYDSPFDLPAVYISGADIVFGEPISAGNKEFVDGIIYSETANQDGGMAYIQGGLAHEFGHQLGLYDLYDTSGRTMGMGSWALMGTGNWNMSGLVPPHHAGYNAYTGYNTDPNGDYANWVYFNQTLEVTNDANNIKLKYMGANEDSSYKLVKIPINAHEYFLIENRYAFMSLDTISDNLDSNGFRQWKDAVLVNVNDYDVSLPLEINTGGLAIYHIDESIIVADSGMNEINAGTIKGIDMEEADKVQDFEMNYFNITDFDKVFTGSQYDVFYRGGVNSSFTPNTMPSTSANNKAKSHLWIYDISLPDTLMTFSVKFNYRLDGFPYEMSTMPDVNAPVMEEINGEKIIFIQTVEGEIYAIDENGNPALNTSGVIATFNGDNESYSTPAFGNVYGSVSPEMVITSYSGDIHVIRTDTINARDIFLPVNGSPFNIDDGIASSAVLYDIDLDGYNEILISGEDMYFHILDVDEDSIYEHENSPVYLGSESWSLPIVVDERIFVLCADGVINAFDFNCNLIYKTDTENIEFTSSSPIAADIDGDDIVEIIFIRGDGSIVSINSNNGEIEFIKNIGFYPFYSSPVVGDVNNDGELEIVLFIFDRVFVIDRNGIIINNYPINTEMDNFIQASPILADINDDEILDILIMLPNGVLDVISENNAPGFPLQTGQSSYVTPLVCDFNNNDLLDIVAVGDNMLYVYEINSGIFEKNWPSYHFDNSNNRYYPFKSTVIQSNELLIDGKNNYIYPNPVYDKFTLRFETSIESEYEISIFDASGKLKIKQGLFNAYNGINEKIIDVTELGAGFYIMKLKIESGDSHINKTFKFVVRK